MIEAKPKWRWRIAGIIAMAASSIEKGRKDKLRQTNGLRVQRSRNAAFVFGQSINISLVRPKSQEWEEKIGQNTSGGPLASRFYCRSRSLRAGAVR
jgi:hypothetical protein